jgi:hypothetical protein
MKKTVLVSALFLLGNCAVWAAGICPGTNPANNFSHAPDPTNTGCNAVITIAANGSVSIAIQDTNPYDGSEDTLVGVVNNSSGTVSAITLAGSGIFGFDGDGICTFTFAGNGYCSATFYRSDPGDYAGPTSTFSNITNGGNNGTVNFSPAIPAGGSTYFSLEGVPGSSSITGSATIGPSTPASVPAVQTWGLAVLAVLLAGLSFRMLQRA